MPLLPYRKLVLHTRLTPQQCREHLEANTVIANPEGLWRREPKNAKFTGYVYGNRFKVRRVIDYRNSFLPIINGEIKPIATGTEISMVLKPVTLVIAFMCFWVGALLFAFFAILIGGMMQNNIPPQVLIMPAMMLGGGSIMYFGFDAEYKNAKKALIEIFKSDSI